MALQVAVVGDGDLAADVLDAAGFEIETAEAAAVEAADVDCVVVEAGSDDPVGTVDRLHDQSPSVPIVVASEGADQRLVTRAFRAGATDHVALDGADSLPDRIRAAVENAGPPLPDVPTPGATPLPFEAVASSLAEVFVTIDGDGAVRYVNDAVTDVFGYDRTAVVGDPLTDLIAPEHRDAVDRFLCGDGPDADWTGVELTGLDADGDPVDLDASFGEFVVDGRRYCTGLLRDVGELAEREAALSDLYDAVDRLLLATSTEEIASITVETASEALDLPITAVHRHDPDRGLVAVAQTDTVDSLFGEVVFEPGDSLAWETFDAGETRVIEDVADHPDAHNPDTSIRTELQVPLGDDWLLVSGTTESREFEQYRIDFAELLATTAAAAMDRARRERRLEGYETVVRNIDERVCVIDVDGRVRMANEAMCSFLDRSDLVGEVALSFVDEEDVPAVEAAVADLDAGESTTVECRIGPEDGQRCPCEIDMTTLPETARMNGVVVAVHDISDRKRVESALEHERDRFAELFEHVPDPVVEAEIVDGEPYVRSVNGAFEDTFDTPESEVVGDPLNEHVLPPEGDDRADELDRRTASGELVETEVKRETGDGIRYFLFRGVPVDIGSGERSLAFGIYTDLTEQRLRERRLAVLNRVFRHNIRNDMNVVIGRAEHIAEASSGQVASNAEVIRRNAARIVELADGIHAAEQALSLEDAPQRPIDEVVLDALEPYRGRDDVDLSVTVPDRKLPDIDERLFVAIDELVGNAVEHVPDSPVAVTVGIDIDEGSVTVSVSDDGPGIPDSERAALDSGPETPLDHGSGVGLWLVRWIATALGGEVVLDDGTAGTTVRLIFPTTALGAPSGGA